MEKSKFSKEQIVKLRRRLGYRAGATAGERGIEQAGDQGSPKVMGLPDLKAELGGPPLNEPIDRLAGNVNPP